MSKRAKAARGFFSDFRSLRRCLGDSDLGKTTMEESFAVMVYLSGMFWVLAAALVGLLTK